jgi:hypothetical protein
VTRILQRQSDILRLANYRPDPKMTFGRSASISSGSASKSSFMSNEKVENGLFDDNENDNDSQGSGSRSRGTLSGSITPTSESSQNRSSDKVA